jgi:uncharacterized protein involved in high-affinity Fe2+ transport
VREVCRAVAERATARRDASAPPNVQPAGVVYLARSGRNYKIGFSNDSGRRAYELRLAMSDPTEIVHEINTDDPVGIERYWHDRFAERRVGGEWFKLTEADVRAFKFRRRM